MPTTPKQPISVRQPTLLVVEGDEDKKFFEALIRFMRLTRIEVVPIGGKTRLRVNLEALVSTPEFMTTVRSLAIVRDADNNPKGAFQSVCTALHTINLPVPEHPLLSSGTNPHVTVMIIPDAITPGMLEDVCLASAKEDPALACVDAYFTCLQEHGITVRDNAKSKARLHTFLASRDKPDLRLGEAAQKGYWDWDHPAFNEVKTFLTQITTSTDS